MANETLGMGAEVAGYVRTVGVREPDVLARLRLETAPMQWAVMQISPEQGALMAMLITLTGARRVLELYHRALKETHLGDSQTARSLNQ